MFPEELFIPRGGDRVFYPGHPEHLQLATQYPEKHPERVELDLNCPAS
jgi:hypothetical protein